MSFDFYTCKLSEGTEVKGLYEIQPKAMLCQTKKATFLPNEKKTTRLRPPF